MVPGWQASSIHCEARLPSQGSADYFARRKYRGMFSTEAYSFTQLDEVFRFQLVTIQKRVDVAGAEVRLLQSKLGCACQSWYNVSIKSCIAERERVGMTC